jgi:hypothetical protein
MIHQLSSIQNTESIFKYGDEIINLSISPNIILTINCITKEFDCKFQVYNCSVKWSANELKANIEITRDIVTINKDDGKRYFLLLSDYLFSFLYFFLFYNVYNIII